MADVRDDGELHMANSPVTRSGEFNQEATKTIMDLAYELHERILMQLAKLDYYYLYDLMETSKYFQNLCQNYIKRNPERNYSAIFESHEKLVWGAASGRLDRVKFYIEEEKIDVDSVGRCGLTALHRASGEAYIEVVNYLISKGANVNITGSRRCEPEYRPNTPILLAAWNGHNEVAKILIQNGAKTAGLLELSVASGYPKMISLAVSHGFDINQHNDLGMTSLATAMRHSRYNSVKFLLENGADYKKTSVSGRFLPIHYGMCMRLWSILPNHTNRYSAGVLDDDSRRSEECLKLLLDYIEQKEGREGVVDHNNSNDNSKGFTALHEACRTFNHDAVKLLYFRGANPNIRDKEGKKPYDHLPRQHYFGSVLDRLKEWLESDELHQDCSEDCLFFYELDNRPF